MADFSTNNWGYTLKSPNCVNIYHVCLSTVPIKQVIYYLPHAKEVIKEKDQSISVYFPPDQNSEVILNEVKEFFKVIEKQYLDTPHSYFTIEGQVIDQLRQWAISFEGCIALILLNHPETRNYFQKDWEFIEVTCGLFIKPFTLMFNDNYVKIIHPIRVTNYVTRLKIESFIAEIVRKLIKRVKDAQPGYEGLALSSFVKEKTNLKDNEIEVYINKKAKNINQINPSFLHNY